MCSSISIGSANIATVNGYMTNSTTVCSARCGEVVRLTDLSEAQAQTLAVPLVLLDDILQNKLRM